MSQTPTAFQTDAMTPKIDPEKLYGISREPAESPESLIDDFPILTEMRERPEIRQKRQHIRITAEIPMYPHNKKAKYDPESMLKRVNQDNNISAIKIILSSMIDDAQSPQELGLIENAFKYLSEQFAAHITQRMNDEKLKLGDAQTEK